MSKVLVDRELLVRLENAYMEGMSIYGECEEIRAVLAQPAEAEGVQTWRERIVAARPKSEPGYWPDALLVEHMLPEIEELRAALSAVTAERDRVLAEREGKVLVPIEPTEAMLTAYSTNPNHVASAVAIYRAMLSAATAAKEA